MDLSINFDFFLVFVNLYSNPYPKIKIFFLFFKLSNSKFAKDLKKTQTQALTNKISKSNISKRKKDKQVCFFR
jgi:hypothetical protein